MKIGRGEALSLALVAAAVASVLLVFFTRNERTTVELEERAQNVLATFREEEVELLVLSRRGTTFSIERRKEDSFVLRTPAEEPADAAAVERLIDGLGFAAVVRRLDKADPAALGLASPRATIAISMRGKRHQLVLGNDAPSPPGAAYVSVTTDGDAPFFVVVGRDLAVLLLTTLDDLRDRALVKLGANDLRDLTLERPDTTVKLTRGKGSAFSLEGGGRANRDVLEPVFAALAELKAARFLPVADAERARGTAPRTRILLGPRDAKARKVIVELGGACPGAVGETLAIVRGDAVRAGCVRDDALAPFSLSKDALADDRPFSARVDEVETLTLVRGSKRLVLARRGTAFTLSEPASAEVELEAGNQRLGAIVRAPGEIIHAPDLQKLGLGTGGDKVVLTVLTRDDKATEESLELGHVEPDGTLPVRRTDDGTVLRIGRDAARAFLVDSTLLRNRRLLDFALSALVELELTKPERQLLRRAPSGFELAVPAGFQVDGELATNAVLGLGSLTAVRWVADTDDGSFGLGAPRATARLHFEQGDAGPGERTLVVGAPAPGGYYARFGDDAGVFLLERAIVERLETSLVDRAATMVAPASLARLTLRKGGDRFVLERRGGELVPAAGSTLDPELVAPLLEALPGLRAEAAVHSGRAQPSEGFSAPSLEVLLEPSAGLGKSRTLRFGVQEVFRGLSARFARIDGVDATFVVAEAKLRPLFDLF